MRRPTIAKKLGIREKPGFSSYLTGQMGADELIQLCGIENNEGAFHVIAAGECPPNPVELLSSENMVSVLASLRNVYDYIIIDLPPVGEVSDAMSVAELLDGMLLVVRQDLCNRLGLSNAVRQFEFVDTKILGVIYNCKNESKGGYGKRYGYGYGKGYYRRYYKYSNYEHNSERKEKVSAE
jgi:capsular exopolysaccharide synthesis family protein